MNFKEILDKYDDANFRKFHYSELRNLLSRTHYEEQDKESLNFELLAFSLVGSSGKNDWGTYYGPMFTGRNEDGTPSYFPSLDSITNEAVLYWESRVRSTVNPLLKMQYAGLVWDFKKKVCSDGYPPTLYSDYVNAMLDVINGDYEPHDVITVDVIERLSSFVKNDEKYKTQIKNALLRFDNERTSEDGYARLWGAYISFITKHKSWFSSKEEAVCIAKHESRLERLASPSQKNPWIVCEQSKALAQYYKSRGDIQEVKRVLLVMERSFRSARDSMTSIQWMGNLEQVANIFGEFGLNDEYSRLLKEIELAGSDSINTIESHNMPIEISQEIYTQIRESLVCGDCEEQYRQFCHYFIPNLANETEHLKKLANQYPLMYKVPTHLMEQNGKPSSIIGGIDTDFEGQLVLHICEEIKINSIFLHYGIGQLKETKALAPNAIISHFKESPIIDISRHEIIRQALLAYDSGNYITMCHLIVPQIENAFRTLIEISGGTVIRPQKDKKGFMQRILDDILRDSVISKTFGEDFAYYTRILLTDSRGLNIRNNLCHGLVEPAFFNSLIADRLLHLFCVLTLVKYE